jgi:hypothetical protein
LTNLCLFYESVDVPNNTIHPPQCPSVDELNLNSNLSVHSLPSNNETGWAPGTWMMTPSSTTPLTFIDFDIFRELNDYVSDSAGPTSQRSSEQTGLSISGVWYPGYLHIAILKNQPLLVAQLLTDGAEPTVLDSKGYSPIHTAAGLRSPDCLSVLLNSKPDPRDLKLNQASYDGNVITINVIN